ncbi:hypothetical protein SARC_05267 [Sphaeroforma arctica JP610]|uniref:MATE efflux family protein n=1 Tax=Sphaeroforma arctica JP610 TaxID=667725 RepID=A0A0L0G011_9EUKA|nr:hypothetical protein SARC_05267 [Sphaeroforma arctica JP610]KNC82452.1 hypothetical protein SARC_05267 [Sphaeroforma arctica JP610]|eukprot:XP_014156354.1 hypothetical protein SARC_05267 [Sphaeroforma arctica JP610]
MAEPEVKRSDSQVMRNEPPVNMKEEFLDLLSMSWQVSLATVTRIALTSIDSAFLGHFGTQYLAAASLAQVWTSLPLMAVWGGTAALITLCGQAWGAGNKELVGIWLQFGVIITQFLGLLVFIWYWCVGFVLQYSSPDPVVVEAGVEFARMLSFSIAPSLFYACLRQYFQAMGIMWATTICGVTSILLTVLLNWLLIYGCFGWSGLGFIGSPLATVIASWYQPLCLFLLCVTWKGYHKDAWYGFDRNALSVERLKVFGGIAFPVAMNSLVSTLANSALTLLAARMGSDVIAANAVMGGLWSIIWALFWGFGCSTQVKVANYMGAGRPQASRKVALCGLACSIVVLLILLSTIFFASRKFFGIYSNDPKILDMCEDVVYIYIVAVLIENLEVLSAAVLTGMGSVSIIFWISTIGTWLIEIPVAFVLGIVYKKGLAALWISILVMEIFKLSFFIGKLMMINWAEQSALVMASMEALPEEDEEAEALLPGGLTARRKSSVFEVTKRDSRRLSEAMATSLENSTLMNSSQQKQPI